MAGQVATSWRTLWHGVASSVIGRIGRESSSDKPRSDKMIVFIYRGAFYPRPRRTGTVLERRPASASSARRGFRPFRISTMWKGPDPPSRDRCRWWLLAGRAVGLLLLGHAAPRP